MLLVDALYVISDTQLIHTSIGREIVRKVNAMLNERAVTIRSTGLDVYRVIEDNELLERSEMTMIHTLKIDTEMTLFDLEQEINDSLSMANSSPPLSWIITVYLICAILTALTLVAYYVIITEGGYDTENVSLTAKILMAIIDLISPGNSKL